MYGNFFTVNEGIIIKAVLYKINSNKYLHALTAMLTTAVIFLIILICCHITPFGKSTWLVFDMKRQYADFYSYYQTIISGKNNIFYAPAMTLGSGAVGFFTYYLSSPFLFIVMLFDKAHIPMAITFMIGIKLVIAAGSCDLFLKHYIGDEKAKTFLFALSYPLCAYMISNSVNPMWLDVFMMMPFVIWMLDRLIDKNARTGYILSLAYIIWCNYYIAFMVCLFIIMWTFYRLIIQKDEFVQKLFRVGICSFWAVALDAILLLPSVIELSGSPKDIFQLGLEANKGNRTIREVMSKMWFLAYNSEQTLYGSALIYAGTIIVILTVLYFTNKRINIKEKIAMAVMMAIFFVSFMIDKINLIWHGGMEPSGYPYREAFMFVFLCIMCSCKCYNTYREGVELKYLLLTGVIVIAGLCFSFTGGYQYVDKRMVICNVLLVTAVLAMFLVYKFISGKGRVRQSSVTRMIERLLLAAFIFVQLAELTANGMYVYKNQTLIGMKDTDFFESTVNSTRELVEYAKKDPEFFRMENMKPREQNDDMMYDFNGVTHYSSAGTIYTRFLLKKMGFNDDRLYTHFGHDNTCTADSLLGIKYLINAGEVRSNYQEIYGGSDGVVQNPYQMSIAWTTPDKPQISEMNAFSLQEKMYGNITGSEVSIFENAIVKDKAENLAQGGISHKYSCQCKCDGYVYFYSNGISDINQNLVIYVDGELVSGYGNLSCMKILNLGYHNSGDRFEVEVRSDNSGANLGEVHVVTENLDKLSTAYEAAKPRNATVERVSSSRYLIHIPDNASDYPYSGIATTIPYSKGWRVKVDGVSISHEQIYDTFIYIPVAEGKLIEMHYEPEGMLEGAIISLIAIIGILLLAVLDRRREM